jgi:lipoprotein-releasing system permease protein
MYKLLLCWRYLRTRYIALASIVSVMLGVATMIVVNAVMAGFRTEMQNRIHGILSDVVVESVSLEGMPDPEWQMQQIREVAGPWIEAMTPTVTVPAMLSFQYGGKWMTRPVHMIGIDEKTQAQVSDLGKYLLHSKNRVQLSWDLRQGGWDTRDHQAGPEAPERPDLARAGWPNRIRQAQFQALLNEQLPGRAPGTRGADPKALDHSNPIRSGSDPKRLPDAVGSEAVAPKRAGPPESKGAGDGPMDVEDMFGARIQASQFDPAKEQHTGLVLGISLASFRDHDGRDRFVLLPGDDVKLTFPTAGAPPKGISDNFTIVDLYESKMSEYDASFVFVPIGKVQDLRGMIDPSSGARLVSSIQIKLKPGVDGAMVRDALRAKFRPELYGIYTWRDKQGPLLAAVEMETAILNVLLFMIIAVSGFGILAIFFMIVVEKTRDVGILKSLGASSSGIMGIFLSYGLTLGVVGSAVGMVLGLLFVRYINEIATLLGKITGRPIFSPDIYYFYKIPAIVAPATVAWIVLGAMAIAVLASVLPALRAALLHPVEALRYE